LVLAAVVAAAVVPVGFALSIESQPPVVAVERPTPLAMTVVVPASSVRLIDDLPDVPDAAKLLGMGAVLLGLAAAVRRVA
jgi:hypothetical protein